MKLYWRVKIQNKWTYKAAETFEEYNPTIGEYRMCVKELKQ